MDIISQNSITELNLISSIEREEMLLKKYEMYSMYLDDSEDKELLEEFKETALEHIDLIKNKLRKLSI